MDAQSKITVKRKILVYLFGSLGDTIVAIPALRAVRRNFATAEIVLLQNAATEGGVSTADVIPADLIDRHFEYQSETATTKKFSTYFGLWKAIRSERFDSVVYLVISERPSRSLRRDRFFFLACGIKELIGFHAFSRERLYPVDSNGTPAKTDHEAVRKLERLERDGITTKRDEDLRIPFYTSSRPESEIVSDWLTSHRKSPQSTLAAIAPGCKTKSNLWPIENFAEIAKRLRANENCEIIIVGGDADVVLGDQIIDALGDGINAAGKFSIRESAILLSHCDFYVGLDTGSTHLASAVGTPCFSIFGERNNPGQWYPLGETNVVLSHPVECSGCRLFTCPIPGHPCMNGIDVDSVWQNLSEFIRSSYGRNLRSEDRIVRV